VCGVFLLFRSVWSREVRGKEREREREREEGSVLNCENE
jgi:hypothetical protein